VIFTRFRPLSGRSAYQVLGVAEDGDAAEINRGYRRRMRDLHPDRGGERTEAEQVSTAYLWLTRHRAEYDRFVAIRRVNDPGWAVIRPSVPPSAASTGPRDRIDGPGGARPGPGVDATAWGRQDLLGQGRLGQGRLGRAGSRNPVASTAEPVAAEPVDAPADPETHLWETGRAQFARRRAQRLSAMGRHERPDGVDTPPADSPSADPPPAARQPAPTRVRVATPADPTCASGEQHRCEGQHDRSAVVDAAADSRSAALVSVPPAADPSSQSGCAGDPGGEVPFRVGSAQGPGGVRRSRRVRVGLPSLPRLGLPRAPRLGLPVRVGLPRLRRRRGARTGRARLRSGVPGSWVLAGAVVIALLMLLVLAPW